MLIIIVSCIILEAILLTLWRRDRDCCRDYNTRPDADRRRRVDNILDGIDITGVDIEGKRLTPRGYRVFVEIEGLAREPSTT